MKLRTRTADMARSLDDIFSEDDALALLDDVTPAQPKAESSEDSARITFMALLDFCEQHGREPDETNPDESALAWNLKGYRTRPELRAQVLELDARGLLRDAPVPKPSGHAAKTVTSLNDILNDFDDDELGLLDDVDTSIFAMKHVKVDKDLPEEIASRKPCEDFYRYERFFLEIQKVLRSKSVIRKRFSKESEVSVGQVFILRGLLCYVDKILKEDSPDSKRDNPRLRVIFANGTETDLLKRSLARALYKDPHSRRVNFDPNLFSEKSAHITMKDTPTGTIYILSSETTAPALAQLKAAGKLVKIGYSTQDVHERLKNAATDPTYLEAPVRVLATMDCYNLNPQKFENLIHAFLCQQKLNITLMSSAGKPYHPEEWFAVNLETATEVCERIVDGTIIQYRIDNTSGVVVKKE